MAFGISASSISIIGKRGRQEIKEFILSLSTPHGSCLTNPITRYTHPLSESWATARSPPITPFASWDLVKTHQTLLLFAPTFCIYRQWGEGALQVWWGDESWEKSVWTASESIADGGSSRVSCVIKKTKKNKHIFLFWDQTDKSFYFTVHRLADCDDVHKQLTFSFYCWSLAENDLKKN